MATVSNWIDHLSASEVAGAVYPGVGSEGILVIVAVSYTHLTLPTNACV